MKLKFFFKKNINLLIFVLGAFFSALTAGIFQVGILLFIYPVLILFSFRNTKKKRCYILYFLIYTLFMIPKYYNLSGGYIWLDIIGFIVFSLIEIIPFVLDSLFYEKVREKTGYLACCVFPLTYILFSMFVSIFYPIIELTASLAPYLWISQIASLFGSRFLTFITLLFSTTVLFIIEKYKSKNKMLKSILVGVFSIIIIPVYGVLKTNYKVDSFEVRVASILGSDLGDFYADSYINSPLEEDKKFLKEKVIEAKELNCDILITAEESCELLLGEEEIYKESVGALAKEYSIPILISVDVYLNEEGSYRKDCIYCFDSNGEFKGEYIKHTLLPYEDLYYLKGESDPFYIELQLDNTRKLHITSSICYDVYDSKFIMSSNKKTNLLVNQSWCWKEIDEQQQNIQLLRSLEFGTSFMSSTIDATSTIYSYNGIKTDEYYRYLDNRRDLKVFTLTVPKERVNTLYSSIYNYIDLTYITLFVLIVILYFLPLEKKKTI